MAKPNIVELKFDLAAGGVLLAKQNGTKRNKTKRQRTEEVDEGKEEEESNNSTKTRKKNVSFTETSLPWKRECIQINAVGKKLRT